MQEEQKAEYDDLRAGLAVHIAGLHKDAESQPDWAFRAGTLAAELKAKAKRAKLLLEQATAEADAKVRANPGQFGLDKITEGAVGKAITLLPIVMSSSANLINNELDADLAATLANAYEHRRSMIKVEVDLYISNYFGDPEVRERDMRQPARAAASKAADEKEVSIEAKRAERRRSRRMDNEGDGDLPQQGAQ